MEYINDVNNIGWKEFWRRQKFLKRNREKLILKLSVNSVSDFFKKYGSMGRNYVLIIASFILVFLLSFLFNNFPLSIYLYFFLVVFILSIWNIFIIKDVAFFYENSFAVREFFLLFFNFNFFIYYDYNKDIEYVAFENNNVHIKISSKNQLSGEGETIDLNNLSYDEINQLRVIFESRNVVIK